MGQKRNEVGDGDDLEDQSHRWWGKRREKLRSRLENQLNILLICDFSPVWKLCWSNACRKKTQSVLFSVLWHKFLIEQCYRFIFPVIFLLKYFHELTFNQAQYCFQLERDMNFSAFRFHDFIVPCCVNDILRHIASFISRWWERKIGAGKI